HYPPNEDRDSRGQERMRDAGRVVHDKRDDGPCDEHHNRCDDSEVHIFLLTSTFTRGKLRASSCRWTKSSVFQPISPIGGFDNLCLPHAPSSGEGGRCGVERNISFWVD